MMSSRVLSRLLPVAEGDVSVFESIRREVHPANDLESQNARSQPDEFFRDHEGDPEQLLFDGTSDQAAISSPQSRPSTQVSPELERQRPRWRDEQRDNRIEEDEDVPESLLLEGMAVGKETSSRPSSQPVSAARQSSAQAKADAQWKATQEQHKLHRVEPSRPSARAGVSRQREPTKAQPRTTAEREAMWLFTNADNLDAFLLEVYQYYAEHGIYSMLLSRALNLLTEVFVFSFATFLTTCLDYSKISTSHSTKEIMIDRCMYKASALKKAALFFFVIYVLWRIRQYVGSIRRLMRMRDFYLHVLGIHDQDIQTVSWVRVVDGLVRVQNANIATAEQPATVRTFLKDKYSKPQQRLSAETIANRLMRQDNFYVAMYNKDILDFTLPIPFLGARQFYSKSLEWCIDFCLTNFIFDEQGNVRPFCLDVRNRKNLVLTLRTRLRVAALTSVAVAPVNILRFCVVYFFRYYTEFTRNPSKASARAFTPFAEWKIREFNELEHLFQRRIQQAYPFANEYLKQFPKDKMDQLCRFIGFVSGAIAAVLTIATLLHPEPSLTFEVTPGRTAVFWLPILLGIFTFAHGILPDEDEVHDPVLHLKEVLMFTHYMPAHWKGRLHSNEVRADFSAMYQLRISIFFEEVLSLILAPWILLRNANDRSDRIIDFFREHSIHVDGIGYQCNFAVFGFKKDVNAEDPTAVLNEGDGLRDDYFGLKDDKMAASVHNFMQYYSHYKNRQTARGKPGWQPPPAWPPLMASAIQEDIEPNGFTTKAATRNSKSGKGRDMATSRQHLGSTMLRSPRQNAQTIRDRLHSSRHPDAADSRRHFSPTALPKSGIGGHDVSESRLMAQDSDLSDYGGLPGREQLDSETEGAESGSKGVAENAGVLGMLYQYSKTQTDKGAGLNIR